LRLLSKLLNRRIRAEYEPKGAGIPAGRRVQAMFRRMLVPVDGTHSSASIVPYAAELAQRLGCRVDLVLVEPPTGARLPHPEHHRASRGRGEDGALVFGTSTPKHVRAANERYVARHVEEFVALGVEASGAVVCGDPVDEILRAALEQRSDVIAMTSRKLSDLARGAKGSISEEVVARSRLPVLVVAHA
jgi:nucleotide-binding universal stress UspA family protein